jgi:hypoxanthine-DNA glycosylase
MLCGGAHLNTRTLNITETKGICIWDVYADVHESGGERNKRRKKVTKSNANDVASFLVQNPSIHKIAFIGKKAFTSFGKEVSLSDVVDIELTTLSSSSPANSRMSVDEKSTQWKQSLVRNIPNL